MKKLAAASRADLLRCKSEFGSLEPEIMALFGYNGEVLTPTGTKSKQTTETKGTKKTGVDGAIAKKKTEGTVEPPAGKPTRLKFLVPVESETLVFERPHHRPGNPIPDAAVALDWTQTGPPLRPLTRWARLAPFLRERLGTYLPGTRLDERKLMRLAGTGLPVLALPRMPRRAWASQSVILWDFTPEMFPFSLDARWLIHRLKRERGAHGLDVRIINRLPDRKHIARIPAGVPVIALSAMGQFQHSQGTTNAWKALANRLAFLGRSFHALNPAPRQRWDAALAAAVPSGVWDRRPRLPRRVGLRSRRSEDETPPLQTERMLDLLSPASRIEMPLLRETRLRLGSRASAATEWEVWHHQQCWQSMDCFGLKAEAYEARLQGRAKEEPALAQDIAALIRQHQSHLTSLLTLESDLRACLSGTPDKDKLHSALGDLQRVIDRLRQLAAQPGSAEIRRSGLAAWFIGMVDRLGGELRAHRLLSEAVAQGLAIAHTCVETRHVVLPTGVDGKIFKNARTEVTPAFADEILCRVQMIGHQTHAEWHLVPESVPLSACDFSLATLRTGRRTIQLTFHSKAGQQHSLQFPAHLARLSLPPLSEPMPVTLETDCERLRLDVLTAPQWADSVFYDRRGLVAELVVQSQKIRLRWAKVDHDPLDDDRGVLADTLRKLFGSSAPKLTMVTRTELMDDLRAEAQPRLRQQREIRFRTKFDALREGAAWVDRAWLRQIVFNLIDNAYKYSTPGSVVDVIVRSVEDETNGNDTVEVIVRDAGIGFRSEDSDENFETGIRRASATKKEARQEGMGLWISENLVKRLGGHLNIVSAPGKGTTVTVSLPWIPTPVSDRDRKPVTVPTTFHWQAESRPAWATRLFVDDYGLAAEFRIRGVPFVLRWIPPGSFLMGSPEDEPGCYDDEGPQHEVTISQGYWLADTPVTQAQWRVVVEAVRSEPALWKKLNLFSKDIKPAPSHFKGPADLPVESVSWHTSRDFCRLLNALLPKGPGFHLPTEAQWEYACRAGTNTALYSGGITIKGENHAPELDDIAWYGGNSGLDLEVSNPESSKGWPNKQFDHQQAGTHRVKLKQANPWGLYDILGNVWEWCADAWNEKGYSNRTAGVTDPCPDSADDSARRVLRGGSCGDHARNCRSASRNGARPGPGWHDRGMRLAAGQNEPGAAEPQEKERSDLPERRSRAQRAGGSGPA